MRIMMSLLRRYMRWLRNVFPKNLGLSGKVLRGLIALLLLWFAYLNQSWVLLLMACFVAFESLMSWCVVFHLLGINQCPINKKK